MRLSQIEEFQAQHESVDGDPGRPAGDCAPTGFGAENVMAAEEDILYGGGLDRYADDEDDMMSASVVSRSVCGNKNFIQMQGLGYASSITKSKFPKLTGKNGTWKNSNN